MARSVFSFFGLRENPFSINPNPRFLYLTPLSQSASEQLLEGIRQHKGLILLTGEVGTGKTLLLRRLLDWLAEQKMPTAFILNSHLNPDHLLDLILNDFGIACDSSLKSEKLIALNRWLLERYRLGQTPVLIIDEAQGLPLQALEEVRLLLNLETPKQKLLQVVLAGQPELEEKLKQYELRQLRQRITVRCRTAPLSAVETQAYIQDRLRTAGAQEPIFHSESTAFVHAYSRGIPRVINLLCEHSLINACADGSRAVSPQFVERAARDCQLDNLESVGRSLNSTYLAGSSPDPIDSIFAGVSLQDSTPPALIPATGPGDSSLALPSLPMDDPEGQGLDRSRPTAKTLTTRRSSRHQDRSADPDSLASNAVIHTPPRMSASSGLARPDLNRIASPAAPHRQAHTRPGISPATASLFQAWWKSFAADARSTWRQLRDLARTQASNIRPFINRLADRLDLASDPRSRSYQFLTRARAACDNARASLLAWLKQIPASRDSSSAGRQSAPTSDPQHDAKIARLRRWLREPLPPQQKSNRNSAQRRAQN